MIATKTADLTLEQLAETVAEFLMKQQFSGAHQDRRITAVPDLRTIRYYTSLGLLDRPQMIGREARYNRRHVLQLLAIKALQTASINLSEIQSRLYGKAERELEAIVHAFTQAKSDEREIEPIVWREVMIEPGLKLLADETWMPVSDPGHMERRIRAALTVLTHSKKK